MGMTTEAAMAAYAEAQTVAVSAGERDLAANEARIAAANELIATDERLSAAQRELANARNAEREATRREHLRGGEDEHDERDAARGRGGGRLADGEAAEVVADGDHLNPPFGALRRWSAATRGTPG